MKGEGEGRLKYRVVMYERVKRIRKIGRRRGEGVENKEGEKVRELPCFVISVRLLFRKPSVHRPNSLLADDLKLLADKTNHCSSTPVLSLHNGTQKAT